MDNSPSDPHPNGGTTRTYLNARKLSTLTPVYDAIGDHHLQSKYYQADETRWRVFVEKAGKVGHNWWLWLFIGEDSAEIVSGGNDGTVVVSNLQPTDRLLDHYRTRTTCSILSPDGSLVYVGAKDGSVRVVDLLTRKNEQIVAPRQYPVSKIVASPSGCLLAVGWEDGEITVAATDARRAILAKHATNPLDQPRQPVHDLRFSSDETRLLCSHGTHFLQLIKFGPRHSEVDSSPAYASTIESQTTQRQCSAICFIGQSAVMANGGLSEDVRSVDFDQADEKCLIRNCGEVSELLYDPQRRSIYCGNSQGQIQRYSEFGTLQAGTARLALSSVPTEGGVGITVLSLAPDGQTLLSGSLDGEVQIWDAETLRYLGTIRASDGRGAISDITFSAAGEQLLIHQTLAASVSGQASQLIELKTPLSNP